ncbi:MAG: exonuclease SbcCD subunit D [Firmicutes bacterium]|nr:exonuclease SbcCD subunit D [Bacillota bacterium]MBR4142056.1 exonuclease SbcCD subunit D [Bacillota bacterium]MBR6970450.1 exonuclease SbcCD subunit D [Bacillota bacterium]
MKLIHLSDLHLGKRVNEFSMIEDQEYILKKIINIIDDEAPNAVILAGDIYDKSIPSAEAVQLFDEFLVQLANRKLEVFVISGNHDSPERIAFGSRLMDASGIHLSPVYNGEVKPFVLKDSYGEVAVYMLPFIKPTTVRRFFDEEIATYTDALKCAIAHMEVDPARRNVLVTHQFVTGAKRSESEEKVIGGLDNVEASVFEPFDYVALGHIHSPQNCGSKKIRYCGTPLKYSFSEAEDEKSVTVVELNEKGSLTLRTVPLEPKRDMVELKGSYDELMARSYYENTTWQEDYTHITLTDEEDVPEAIGRLRTVYHGLMKLDYDNMRTRSNREVQGVADVETKTPYELFSDFYELMNNQEMSEDQSAFLNALIEKVWRD